MNMVTKVKKDKSRRLRCYVAGRISGLPVCTAAYNFRSYSAQVEAVLGMTAVNPMAVGLDYSRPHWMHMVYDLWLLLRCDCVFFMPDWERSPGARLEHRVAKFLRRPILLKKDILEEKDKRG